MEFLIYVLALGVGASLIVPIAYSFIAGKLPASIGTNAMVPTAYPKTAKGIVVSVLFWGLFLGGALYLLSMVKPVGEAIRRQA